ncbi:type II toxin-antitoxin system VapB family antitoxin [Moraxella nasibovis]|uniref:antitoxin n=1 Tax=Moraxella nasibovis TaxID=2904120 RepID=UPI00240F8CF1|nr:type II toxin-antitoxin system VapB family antitoxin [Moraxella nasibovis]WFF39102.1 type II toxin-antitoxin system VapB family antitoxin [Moraxella nasibovis]
MSQTATAKLFWTGNSQAVRLPKAFRFEGTEVKIKKQGRQVIIEPVVNNWDFVKDLEPFDESMERAIAELRNDPITERDWSAFE